MLQKEAKHLPVQDQAARFKTPCILECYYDKELQCCGSCFRTLNEIAEAGKKKKNEYR
jgi:predicted Fe-S protein YdhL (DUF1289 family)